MSDVKHIASALPKFFRDGDTDGFTASEKAAVAPFHQNPLTSQDSFLRLGWQGEGTLKYDLYIESNPPCIILGTELDDERRIDREVELEDTDHAVYMASRVAELLVASATCQNDLALSAFENLVDSFP